MYIFIYVVASIDIPATWSMHGALQCCAEVVLYVQNICEGASSPDTDVDRYVTTRKQILVYLPSQHPIGTKIAIRKIPLNTKYSLKVWRTLRDVLDKVSMAYTQRCFRQSWYDVHSEIF
jgi:hypothetical protein